MTVLVAESVGYSEEALDRYRSLGPVRTADLDVDALDDDALRETLAGVEVLVVRLRNRIDERVLDAAPALRAVVTPTTGLDHVDLAACDARLVAVLSLRGETDFLRTVTATAEHTWALLLALVRNLPAASLAAAAGEWDRDRFRGRELKGKVLGIVGLGRLGTMVARYGRAFGMEVAGFDPHLEDWPEGVERAASLHELAERAHVLTLHVPLDDATRGLVGAGVLTRMRPGAVLVNTSRGELVDEAALLAALDDGRLAGAALDVVSGETSPEGPAASPLVRRAARDPRLLLTPHIGGATLESMENTEIFMAEKLARWRAGHPVSVEAGPAADPRPAPPSGDPA